MNLVTPGKLITYGDPTLLGPAEAPYPSLVDSDVIEPPLPEVRSQPPASTPPKAEAKAIEVPYAVITMAILVSFFISV